MAYDFTSASAQYLSTTATPVASAPLTMACWFRPKNTTESFSLLSINPRSGSLDRRLNLQAAGAVTGSPVRYVVTSGAGTGLADTTTGYTANTWWHACAVSAAGNSNSVFLNGGSSGGLLLDTATAVTRDTVAIGARYAASWGAYASALIAEVGIWSAALTASEILSLASGVSPELVRPQSLALYAPLVRDLVDVRGGLTITNNSAATVAEHPRVYA